MAEAMSDVAVVLVQVEETLDLRHFLFGNMGRIKKMGQTTTGHGVVDIQLLISTSTEAQPT